MNIKNTDEEWIYLDSYGIPNGEFYVINFTQNLDGT